MTNLATNSTTMTTTMTCGLDLGDKWSHACVLGPDGEIAWEERVRTTREGMSRFLSRCAPMRVVMEVGTHSPWASRLADELGHEVLVANARRLQLISQNARKDDRVDAELLARVGRLDPNLLKPIKHRTPATQEQLTLIRARAALVKSRTGLINAVRGLVKSSGHRMPSCSSEAFGKQVAAIPESLKAALEPMMEVIRKLTTEVRAYDKRLEVAAEALPETAPLRSVPGVGPLTALAFLLTLEDNSRFPNGRAAAAFLGLVPRRRQSGKGDPELRISKHGDTYLRQLLVGSAHYVLGPFGPDTDLKRWGLALAARGGKNAKKRAVVAVARKLAVLLFRLWQTGDDYQPLRQATN